MDNLTEPRLLLRTKLLRDGFSDKELRRMLQTGVLQRIARGSYCEQFEAEGKLHGVRYRLRVLAAAARSPDLVLCRESALTLHRLPLLDPRGLDVHLMRHGDSGARRSPGRVVHACVIDPDDVTVVDGVAALSLPHALVDYARTASLEEAVVPLDEALALELVTHTELAAALGRIKGRRGAGSARRAVAFASGRSESVGESRLRLRMRLIGLPSPQLQVDIRDAEGNFVARVDALLAEYALIIEFDGRRKYLKDLKPGQTEADVVLAERARERKLLALGYVVIRIIWSELPDLQALKRRFLSDMQIGLKRMELGGPAGTASQATFLRGKQRPEMR